MPANNNYRRQNSQRFDSEARVPDVAGRMAPRAVDMEEAVLGALMLERAAFPQVCEIITPESFYEPANRKVYEAIQTLGLQQ